MIQGKKDSHAIDRLGPPLPMIQISPGEIDFGVVHGPRPDGWVESLTIANTGGQKLNILLIITGDEENLFYVTETSANGLAQTVLSIAPEESRELGLRFIGSYTAGIYTATLNLHSNDMSHSLVQVPLRGVVGFVL